jgi:flavin-dependent dehydrogenase
VYDVIVVGARCGGAPTAMLLARKGYKVLLVDRATFPSSIPHGHFIHNHGPRRLHRWGLLERIVATGCPPVSTATIDLGDFPLIGEDLIVDDVAYGYAPRRAVLDQILVSAAVEAGAEPREGFGVDEFVGDGDRIVGIRGHDVRSGAVATEHATVTVGADGRHSRLARAVKAPAYEATPPLACWYFSYWSGVPSNGLEIYVRPQRIIFAFPTNDDLFAIFIGWPIAEFPAVRADTAGQFRAAIALVPPLAERVLSARRAERFYGTADVPNFLRKPYGPGWALVGDAGCHKDPVRALGVCDALRDAELLADALDTGLAGRAPLEVALATYERERNEATLPDYRQNLAAASLLAPPPEVLHLRAGLRDDPLATRDFFLARAGMIPPEQFFNQQKVERLMDRAYQLERSA